MEMEKYYNELEDICGDITNVYTGLRELYKSKDVKEDRAMIADWLDKVSALKDGMNDYLDNL